MVTSVGSADDRRIASRTSGDLEGVCLALGGRTNLDGARQWQRSSSMQPETHGHGARTSDDEGVEVQAKLWEKKSLEALAAKKLSPSSGNSDLTNLADIGAAFTDGDSALASGNGGRRRQEVGGVLGDGAAAAEGDWF